MVRLRHHVGSWFLPATLQHMLMKEMLPAHWRCPKPPVAANPNTRASFLPSQKKRASFLRSYNANNQTRGPNLQRSYLLLRRRDLVRGGNVFHLRMGTSNPTLPPISTYHEKEKTSYTQIPTCAPMRTNRARKEEPKDTRHSSPCENLLPRGSNQVRKKDIPAQKSTGSWTGAERE